MNFSCQTNLSFEGSYGQQSKVSFYKEAALHCHNTHTLIYEQFCYYHWAFVFFCFCEDLWTYLFIYDIFG